MASLVSVHIHKQGGGVAAAAVAAVCSCSFGGKRTERQRQLLALLFFKTPDQGKACDSLKGRRRRGETAHRAIPQLAESGLIAQTASYCWVPGRSGTAWRGGGSTLKPRANAQNFGSLRAHRQTDTSIKRWPTCLRCDWPQKVHSLLSYCIFFLPLSRNSWRKRGSAAEGKGARFIFYLFSKPSWAALRGPLNSTFQLILSRREQMCWRQCAESLCLKAGSGRGDATRAQMTHRCLLADCGNVLKRLLVVQLSFRSFLYVRRGVVVKTQSDTQAIKQTVAL